MTKKFILKAISKVLQSSNYKVNAKDIVEAIVVKDKKVFIVIKFFFQDANEGKIFIKKCEEEIIKIKKIEEVSITLALYKESQKNNNFQGQETQQKSIPGIKNIIVVASGKGGVGKSTISVGIATSLAQKGYKVGLIDADILGPSIFRMLKLGDKPEIDKKKYIIPFNRYGVKVISIGSLIDQGSAIIWRGPMIVKALYQLFMNVAWGDIDYMIVDTPPGTGDIHISLAKNFCLSSVVLVSTPQKVAVDDLQRSLNMFQKLNIPISGVIENMSYFLNPVSMKKEYIFGKGSVETLAKNNKIEYLGEIALIPYISKNSDKGVQPINDGDFPENILKKIIYNFNIE